MLKIPFDKKLFTVLKKMCVGEKKLAYLFREGEYISYLVTDLGCVVKYQVLVDNNLSDLDTPYSIDIFNTSFSGKFNDTPALIVEDGKVYYDMPVRVRVSDNASAREQLSVYLNKLDASYINPSSGFEPYEKYVMFKMNYVSVLEHFNLLDVPPKMVKGSEPLFFKGSKMLYQPTAIWQTETLLEKVTVCINPLGHHVEDYNESE